MKGRKWVWMVCESIRRLVIVLMVIWLAVFAPATCQYHGFLLGQTYAPEPEPIHPPGHVRQQSVSSQQPTMLADTPDNALPLTGPAISGTRHKSVGSDVSLMMTISLIATVASLLEPPTASSARFAAPMFAHLLTLPPPDQPPRLLSA